MTAATDLLEVGIIIPNRCCPPVFCMAAQKGLVRLKTSAEIKGEEYNIASAGMSSPIGKHSWSIASN